MTVQTSVLLANLGSLDATLAAAAEVEAAGLDRVWLAETSGPDPLLAAALIAREHDLEVGTAVVPVWSRTPAVLAAAAADIAAIGHRRPFHLGLGAGGQAIVERWHGLDFAGSVERVADTIAILRQALAGERTAHHGDRARSEGFRLSSPPCAGDVDLYVGGMGPRMLDLAGRVADGLILSWSPARDVPGRLTALRDGAVASGRSAQVRLVTRVYAAVTDDPAAARQGVRTELVEYLASPPYARWFRSIGFEEEVDAVAAAFAARDRAASAAAISDRMVDDLLIAGDAATVLEGIAAYARAGADDVMVQPVPPERGGDVAATIAALGR